MQNRRFNRDDERGLSENLNELESANYHGIKSRAKYYLEIVDLQKEESSQRKF
jgi:hypothetical protein